MVQSTDRVIAKTLARVLRTLVRKIDLPLVEAALLLSSITADITAGNKKLDRAIIVLLREVSAELNAEADGVASSTINPQPWEEDAGSGDGYDEYDDEYASRPVPNEA